MPFFTIKSSREKFFKAIQKRIEGPPLAVRGAASLMVPGGQTLRPKFSSLGGFWPLPPKGAIPHPITIQNVMFRSKEFFLWDDLTICLMQIRCPLLQHMISNQSADKRSMSPPPAPWIQTPTLPPRFLALPLPPRPVKKNFPVYPCYLAQEFGLFLIEDDHRNNLL